ncbi:MAG: ABC transporter permease [Pyrinomonadaceae bacterium]
MNRLSYIGFFLAAVFILTAIFAPAIAPHDPIKQFDRYSPEEERLVTRKREAPSKEFWFGTDNLGRDTFSRLVHGARVSLLVGISVVVISGIIGVVIGALAGFYGGWLDKILAGYLFNVVMAFPGLLLAIAIVAFLSGTNPSPNDRIRHLIIAMCITGWVGYARVMRGQVLKVREYDYVQAARALGAGSLRQLFVHILPNAIQPLIVQASLAMAGAVLAEASLSFLGLGIPPPYPTWGTMIDDARGIDVLTSAPYNLIFPGAALALTVLAFNFIGDGLREYLDPKQRKR